MNTLREAIQKLMETKPSKLVLSIPAQGETPYQRVVVRWMEAGYQIESYTEKQVFHKNIPAEELGDFCLEALESSFRQLNAWAEGCETAVRITRKGKVLYSRKKAGETAALPPPSHNRKKNYLLPEGQVIEPLVDMGIFSKEGKILKPMYDKYKQINRFLEIIDDAVKKQKLTHLNIIDFGCGKSYLTFIVYYYLTQVRGPFRPHDRAGSEGRCDRGLQPGGGKVRL